MLKTWAMWGVTVGGKQEHRETWSNIQADAQNDLLLPDAILDEQARPLTAENVGGFELAALRDETRLPPLPDIMPKSLLGKKADDVPAALHAQCEQLARTGQFPVTTPGARARNRKSTSCIGVPSSLADAKKFGYVGPNNSPPQGFAWKFKANAWLLAPRGG
eukprot:4001694-Alexandrium_andersonii.AAC.1